MRSIGLAAATIALLLAACGQPQTLVGDPLPSAVAPNFTLLDGPTGELVTLSSFTGRAVLLTFLYTSCVDTCPLTAETLRNARDRLGDAAKNVAFIAVSVDPIGDTPVTTRRFVEDHRLQGTLRYLIGSRGDLAKVWQAYGIFQEQGSQSVAHTDVIYLIDKHERGRVVLHSDVGVDALATDLRILAGER